jgi:hypothetical protein
MKRGSSQPKVHNSEATIAAGRADPALVELVRLLARQAARELAVSENSRHRAQKERAGNKGRLAAALEAANRGPRR